jgi:hypothetical protein
MKLTTVAAAVHALLATDAKPTEAQIMAACIAADKKGKDEGGLGPVEIQNKAKDEKEKAEDAKEFGASDAAAEYFGHTKDEWEDMPAKDRKSARDEAAEEEEKAKDSEVDAEDDLQPKESVTGGGKPAGNAGPKPASDKKGMDAAGVAALIAANDAKHVAAREVESILGVVAYDSADAYYKAALDKLGVDTAGVHASAFPSMLKLARDKVSAQTPTMASDASMVKNMATAIKGYDRLAAR